MTIDVRTWATDHSLFYRLKYSVEVMVRGKGNWGDRAKDVFSRLGPVNPASFPTEYRNAFERICELQHCCTFEYEVSTLVVPSALKPRQKQEFCDALLFLYEGMLVARARLEDLRNEDES